MCKTELEKNIIKVLNIERSEKVTKLPKKIMFELTNICNMKCIFCSNQSSIRQRGFMDFDLFRRVLDDAVKIGIEECALYTTGESFMHPEIMKFIKYSSGYKLYNYISTGGNSLDETMIDQLLISGLKSIKFSIDAGTEETYKSIKGKHFSLKTLYKRIQYLFRERERRGSELKIYGNYVITGQNENEIDKFMELFYPILDDVHFKFVGANAMKLIRIQDFESCLETKYSKMENQIVPCPLLWERFIVQLDGSLTICCLDYDNNYIYSNVNSESLEQAWNNNTMQNFRNEMITNNFDKLKFCTTCETARSNRANLVRELNQTIKQRWTKRNVF